MRCLLSVIMVGLLAARVCAAPTIDGTKDAAYGAALAVQTVQTGFGDNNSNPGNGSEMDAGYGIINSGALYLMLTGNIEPNFNKLEIFIDSKAGGQSVFSSAGNDGAGAMNGLVFDAGFTADYHLIVRRGNAGTDRLDVDFADLNAGTFSSYSNVFGGTLTGSGTTGTGINLSPIGVGYDNSNVGGVTGGSNALTPAEQIAAAGVTTGLELGITLADLGYTAGPIRVMVGQNNQNHNYWSNQFLAGLPGPQGNLGGDESGGFNGSGAINMTHFGGNQFFTIAGVPEPSSIVLVSLALAGLVGCGRRRT